jgi:hypothetical protein
MPFAVYVEWINGSKAERLFKQRRAAAIRKAHEIDPDRPVSEIVSPEAEDSWWDWVEMDECNESRAFPSVAMAKGWAKRYGAGLDLFGKPRVYKNEWAEGERPWNSETTIQLEYQGEGQWMDLATDRLFDCRAASS